MILSLTSIEKTGCVRIAAEGRITAQDLMGIPGTEPVAPGSNNPLYGLLGPTWADNQIVLDFAQVTWVDSAALGWLMTCNKQCRNAGGALALHSVQPAIRQLMDLLKITKVLNVAEDESSALLALAAEQPKTRKTRKSA